MSKMKFKQTEIGKIPEDWEVISFDDIEFCKGKKPKETSLEPKKGFLPYILIEVLNGNPPIYANTENCIICNKDDLIMVMDGASSGRIARGAEGILGSTLALIRLKTDIIRSDFLYYEFLVKQYELQENTTGSAIPHVDKKRIIAMKIAAPKDPNKQRAIAKILSDLDSKIELNQRMNKTLEAITQAIFKHWFIDFEFPNENGQPYKFSSGEMVDSEMGPIPKGWNVKSLNQIANFLNGLAMQKYRPENDENYLPVLKIKELKIGKTSKNSDKCSMNIDPKYIVDDGDIVFSWSGSLEVKLWCGGKAGLNQHLFKVTSANYSKWFYYYWIKHHIEDFRRIAEDKTTTMGHIKREHLRKAKVLDPGEYFFEKFDKVVNGLIELYINNEKEIKYLSQLRDILLPKLMSGEIRVPINSKVLIS